MKVGDLVTCWPAGSRDMSHSTTGLIVAFNCKGEGGKEFVHVFCEGRIALFMSFDIEVIS